MSDVTAHREASQTLGNTPIGDAVRMRERMRALIHAEVEKLNPTDDARRALELIIESSLRPASAGGELKLTVIDGHGRPRMIEKDGQQVPFTLQDLIDELRAAHPVLFKSPPKPVDPGTEAAVAKQPPARRQQASERDWLKLDSGEPEPVSNPAPAPGLLAPAHWRRGKVRFHGWSRRMSQAMSASGPVAGMRKGVTDSIAESKERAQAFFDNLQEKPVSRRPGFALGAVAAALLLLLAAGAFLLLRPDGSIQASPDGPSETGTVAPGETASAPAPRTSRGGTLRGVPDVIDTATLSLNGEVVRLFGVEWAPGAGKPDDLTNYLQGREVVCEPTGSIDTFRCRVGDQDLSRVILFNGGGQPTAEATPELKAAADHAREAKLGVWSQQP